MVSVGDTRAATGVGLLREWSALRGNLRPLHVYTGVLTPPACPSLGLRRMASKILGVTQPRAPSSAHEGPYSVKDRWRTIVASLSRLRDRRQRPVNLAWATGVGEATHDARDDAGYDSHPSVSSGTDLLVRPLPPTPMWRDYPGAERGQDRGVAVVPSPAERKRDTPRCAPGGGLAGVGSDPGQAVPDHPCRWPPRASW